VSDGGTGTEESIQDIDSFFISQRIDNALIYERGMPSHCLTLLLQQLDPPNSSPFVPAEGRFHPDQLRWQLKTYVR